MQDRDKRQTRNREQNRKQNRFFKNQVDDWDERQAKEIQSEGR